MVDQHYTPSTGFDDQRELIHEHERVEDYDVIHRHDHALMNAFKFYVATREKSTGRRFNQLVPMVFATPRREWLERDLNEGTDERYTASEWEGDYPPTQLERLTYPSISVTRLDATFDQVRWTYTPWRKLLYSNDLNHVLEANFPLPYNFSYQFDFWVLEQAHLNMMIEQMARKFIRPTMWLDVQYPPPWETQTVHMQASPVLANTSVLEGGEQQRELRGVATVNVFGWIPLPTRWVRTIQKYSLEVVMETITGEAEEIIAHYETEYASKQEFWETGETEQILEWK
jgi:hypothetical protein